MNSDDLAQSISALLPHAAIQRLSYLLFDSGTVLDVLTVGFAIGRYRASAFQNCGEALLSGVALTSFGLLTIV